MTVAATVRHAADYTQQAEVTNWPARIVLVVVVLILRAPRRDDFPDPDAPWSLPR